MINVLAINIIYIHIIHKMKIRSVVTLSFPPNISHVLDMILLFFLFQIYTYSYVNSIFVGRKIYYYSIPVF